MPISPAPSLSVIRRLPRYHRYLSDLAAAGVSRISSGELAERMELTASQVRQGFSCFGGLGQQGLGYSVPVLLARIGELLGLRDGRTAVLLGAGNIGRALLNNFDFASRGFTLTGAFDVSPALIGTCINGCAVYDADELPAFCAARPPDVAVLSVPREQAVRTAERCVALGVKGFWNFSNMDINLPGVIVENVHFSDSLMTLCYRLRT